MNHNYIYFVFIALLVQVNITRTSYYYAFQDPEIKSVFIVSDVKQKEDGNYRLLGVQYGTKENIGPNNSEITTITHTSLAELLSTNLHKKSNLRTCQLVSNPNALLIFSTWAMDNAYRLIASPSKQTENSTCYEQCININQKNWDSILPPLRYDFVSYLQTNEQIARRWFNNPLVQQQDCLAPKNYIVYCSLIALISCTFLYIIK